MPAHGNMLVTQGGPPLCFALAGSLTTLSALLRKIDGLHSCDCVYAL